MKIDFSKVDQSKSWPIEEAKTILKNFKDKTNKGYILFQTGYGPSGLPHIGTFAEVSRTQMVMKMLNKISDIPTKLFTFSDDYDALRKVPENIPNQDKLAQNLHKPLTDIPDPFGKFNSFGEHNNEKLISFLNKFNFKYTFKSSKKLYQSGYFNETLKLSLENYQGIMDIILPTLRKERQKTYSPFFTDLS